MRKKLLLISSSAAIVIYAVRFFTGPHHTGSIEDPLQMTAAIRQHIPPGTSTENAQRFMESEGFKCSMKANGQFLDRDGIDYLYCDRHDGGYFDFVVRRWQIAIVYENGHVVEIITATGLIGP